MTTEARSHLLRRVMIGALLAVGLGGSVASLLRAQVPDRRIPAFWSSGDLKNTLLSELVPRRDGTAVGIAAKALVNMSTHAVLLATRAKSFPEVHTFDTDIFVIQEGEGTIEIGGELVDRKETSPGQVTGTSVRGGQPFKASVGDVVYIPKGVPHLWHIPEGRHVTYLAIKVTEK